jgi:hypothetical protein
MLGWAGGYGGCWLLSLARKLAGLFRGLPLAERAIQAWGRDGPLFKLA